MDHVLIKNMKRFDLKYNERMKNHSSPVDTEQLWKDIQKKKRKPTWDYILVGWF